MAEVTKKQIMDSNRFKVELVALRQQREADAAVRDYTEWKRRNDEAISQINARIRATNLPARREVAHG